MLNCFRIQQFFWIGNFNHGPLQLDCWLTLFKLNSSFSAVNSANYRGNIGKERKKFKFIFFYFSSGEDIQRMMALEKHTVYGLNLQGGMRNRVKVQTVKFQTVRTGYRVNSWDEICGKNSKIVL